MSPGKSGHMLLKNAQSRTSKQFARLRVVKRGRVEYRDGAVRDVNGVQMSERTEHIDCNRHSLALRKTTLVGLYAAQWLRLVRQSRPD